MEKEKKVVREGKDGLILCGVAAFAKVIDVLSRRLMGNIIDKEIEVGAGLFICIATICVFTLVFQYLLPYVNSRFEASYTSGMFSSIHKAVLSSKQEEIDGKNNGEISTCFLSDTNGVLQFLKRKLTIFIPDLISFVICGALLIKMKLLLGVLTLATGCISAFCMVRLSKSMIPKMIDYQNKLKDINRLTSDGLINIEMIKVNLMADELNSQYKTELDKLQKIKRRLALRQAFLSFPSMILSFATITTIAFYGGYCVINNQMSLGSLLAAIAMSDYIVSPIMRLENTIVQHRRSLVNRENITKILNMKPENSGCQKFSNSNKLAFENVLFNYPDGRVVFKNLNIEFEKGRINYIIGKNGIGKTTLLKLLAGIYDIEDGVVFVPFEAASKEILREKISVMTQEPVLFSDSIKDNIFLNKNYSKNRFETLSSAINLENEIMSFDNGYDTVLQENGDPLSGGQKKRLSFLRSVLKEAPVYIFDEPTSNVDKNNAMVMMDNIVDLAKDHYVIMITHDDSLVEKYPGQVHMIG